jgi:4a-hydroxytetrahydrobiopterin dehydratase
MNLTNFLKKNKSWFLHDNTLNVNLSFANFLELSEFITFLNELSINEDHHPKVLYEYTNCKLTYFTHDLDKITEKDIKCAKSIEKFLNQKFKNQIGNQNYNYKTSG